MDDKRYLHEIGAYRKGRYEMKTRLSAQERSMELKIDGQKLVKLSVLPDMLEELAVGYVFSEGILRDIEEYMGLDITRDPLVVDVAATIDDRRISMFRNHYGNEPGYGSDVEDSRQAFPELQLDPVVLLPELEKFSIQSHLNIETKGVHCAAVLYEGTQLYFAEDISRYNAVDKVCGLVILEDVPVGDCVLVCSGRISTQVVRKAVRLGFAAIISQSAATSEAIHLAWKHKIYLIAFAGNDGFDVLTGFDEIRIGQSSLD